MTSSRALEPLFSQLYQPCLLTVAPTMALLEVLLQMCQCSTSYAVVQSPQVGLLTDREIVRAIAAGTRLADCSIADVMLHQPVTISEAAATNPFTVFQALRAQRIRYLPVVDAAGQVLGVLTPEAVLNALQPTDLLRLRQVAEVMETKVIVATASTLVQQLAMRMAAAEVSSIVIVAAGASETAVQIPIGLVNAWDIVQLQVAGANLTHLVAAQVMRTPLVSLSPQDSLWHAHQQMRHSNLHGLVAVNDRRELLGVVSPTNILRALDPIDLYATISNLRQTVDEQAAMLAVERETHQRLTQELVESQRRSQVAEARLSQILDSAIVAVSHFRVFPDGTWQWDERSPGCEHLFGYRADELLAQPNLWLSQIFPEDLESVIQPVLRSLTADQTTTLEYRFYHKDGSVRWISAHLTIRRNQHSSGWAITAVETDMTDRVDAEIRYQTVVAELEQRLAERTAALQQAHRSLAAHTGEREDLEEELHAAQNKLSDILNQVLAAITSYRIAADGQVECLYRSAGSEMLFGFTAEELGSDDRVWESRVYPGDLDVSLDQLVDRFAEQPVLNFEFRFYRKDGSLRWIASTVTARWDETTQSWIVTLVEVDITDRKQAEAAQVVLNREVQQLNQELLQSQAKLNDVLNNANAAIVSLRISVEGQVECDYRSPACAAVFGYTVEELQADPSLWPSRVHPDDRHRTDPKQFMSELETQNELTQEFRFYHRDGSLRWIAGNYSARWDDTRQCWIATLIDIDITARKQAEAAHAALHCEVQQLNQQLQASQVKLNDILNTVNAAIASFRVYADGRLECEYRSAGCEAVYGYTTAEMVGPDNLWAKRVHPSDVDRVHVANVVQECAAEGSVMRDYRFYHKDGSLRWISCTYTMRWNDALQCWIATLIESDITAQKQVVETQARLNRHIQQLNADLEQQVKARTAQLQLAYEFESTLKQITDQVRDSLDETQILQNAVRALAQRLGVNCCNAALFNFDTGTSQICFEYAPLVSPTEGRVFQMDDYPVLYRQLLDGWHFQFCSLRPNPQRGRQTRLTCPILDDQGVLGALWLINDPEHEFSDQDIRLVQQVANQCAIALRQSRLYQAAQAQVEELQRLDQLKDDFLSTISHELRTPMASIQLAIDLLESSLDLSEYASTDTDPDTDSPEFYLEILRDQCRRETTLLNNLLDFTRLTAGTQALMPAEIDLQTWLPQFLPPFVERTRSQQQSLDFDLPSRPVTVTIDPTVLEHIITELLNNACKYTPAHAQIRLSVQVRRDTKAGASSKAAYLILQVRNSGVEIPARERHRIFDRFYRIPNNDPWKFGGTGLGLALVKKQVELLQGTIRVTSRSGWTIFTVQLPTELIRSPRSSLDSGSCP